MPGIRLAVLLATSMILSSACGVYAQQLPFSMVYYPAGWGFWLPSNMSGFREIGFDAFYYNGYWQWDDPDAIRRWAVPFSLACAENNMSFVAGLYWYWVRGEEFEYAHAVDQFGYRMDTQPSPVSDDWWREMMEAPAVYLANLSLFYPIWGVVWDTEDYSRSVGGVWVDVFQRGMYSFDDEAMEGYARDTGRSIPDLSLSQRRDWLRSNGLLEEFQDWEANRTYQLAKRMADRVYQVNPDFNLGLFPLDNDWWQLAVLKGFSAHRPVGAWTGAGSRADTYQGISRGLAESLRSVLEEKNISATLVAGVGPWIRLSKKETAVRFCDATWFYGTIPKWAEDEIRVVRRYIYFNQTHANMLPSISFGPDVYAHPYLSPDGKVSFVLGPHESGKTLTEGIKLLTSSDVICIPDDYGTNRNASITRLIGPDPTVSPERLPCLVYGMDETDLLRTGIWYLTNELSNLSLFYSGAGLGELPRIQDALEYASTTGTTDPHSTLQVLLDTREEVYKEVLEEINRVIEEPGNISVPAGAKAKAWLANLFISKGQEGNGQSYVYGSLEDWYAAGEEIPIVGLFAVLFALFRKARDNYIA